MTPGSTPTLAATQLNWLVMGEPVNRAMLLGEDAELLDVGIAEHVRKALDVFLAAHPTPPPTAQRLDGV